MPKKGRPTIKLTPTTLYTRAVENLNEGLKYLKPTIGKSESDLKTGFNQLNIAYTTFQGLETTTTSEVLKKNLRDKKVKAVEAMVAINSRLNSVDQEVKISNTPIQQSSYLEGIEYSTEDDQAILRKVQNAIVPLGCGFRKFEDYVGGKPYESFFDNIVVWRKKYQNFNDAHKGTDSILLFGPPGTGKTLLAQALNSKFPNAVFFSISASDIKGRYFSESEKTLHVLFQLARNYTRKDGKGPYGANTVIIFMDEIDGLIDEGGSGVGTGLLSQFNNEIQGLGKEQANKGLIVIGATNYPDKIPAAAFQRFALRPFVGLPTLNNAREILMKKFREIGWDAVNFTQIQNLDKIPIWMQSIDWDRDEHITNFLTKDSEMARKYSIPGTYTKNSVDGKLIYDSKGNWEDESLFYQPYTEASIKREQVSSDALGKKFFDIFLGYDKKSAEESSELYACPWDIVDYMSLVLFNQFYAPREIDAVFNVMLLQAEKRSVYFATQNPLDDGSDWYQKWLLDKRKIMVKGSPPLCKDELKTKYSLIPLWYTTSTASEQGDNDIINQAKNENFVDAIILGSTNGIKKFTKKDGKFDFEIVPKFFQNKDGTECKVVVSKATVIRSKDLKTDIVKGPKNIGIKYELKRKQDKFDLKPGDLFVPTVEWKNIPKDEQMDSENMPRILGISQLNYSDFLQAIYTIKSIPILNVDKMIEYAVNYGTSLKDGEDIQQLKRQAVEMKRKQAEVGGEEGDTELMRKKRTQEVFGQLATALAGFKIV